MKIRRIDFSPDEWIAGTVGLDNAERGLYITACALIYSHGGPIPVEQLRGACLDHGHAFKRQLNRLLSTDKLLLHDGQIDNKRCANELQKAVTRAAKDRQKDPQSANSNGLEPSRGAARAQAGEPSTINQGSDLSGLKAKEGSEPSRTRAREGAGGASLASPASNHQSEAAAEAEREARRQRGLQEALAALEVWKAEQAALEAAETAGEAD